MKRGESWLDLGHEGCASNVLMPRRNKPLALLLHGVANGMTRATLVVHHPAMTVIIVGDDPMQQWKAGIHDGKSDIRSSSLAQERRHLIRIAHAVYFAVILRFHSHAAAFALRHAGTTGEQKRAKN